MLAAVATHMQPSVLACPWRTAPTAVVPAPAPAPAPVLHPLGRTQAPKEWYFYPNGYDPERSAKAAAAAAAAPADASAPAATPTAAPAAAGYTVGDEVVPGPDESGRAGPMSKDALRQLHSKGVVCSSTWVWAGGMPAPQQLSRVRELRWMLSSGLGLLGPFDAALVALQASVRAVGVSAVVVEWRWQQASMQKQQSLPERFGSTCVCLCARVTNGCTLCLWGCRQAPACIMCARVPAGAAAAGLPAAGCG